MVENSDKEVDELEKLDVVEGDEIKIGKDFFAFKFKNAEPIDPETTKLVERAKQILMKTRNIDEKAAMTIIEDQAQKIPSLTRAALDIIKSSKLLGIKG